MTQERILKIESSGPNNVLRLELFLSDFCNYKCWYCSKDFNGQTVRWPNLDPLLDNFNHLLNYYKSNGKTEFIIHIGGGEPSQWPELVEFVLGIKKHHKCIISLTTNGSRTLRWWHENVRHFDHIGLSVHFERADPEHLKNVGDIIYENNVSMWASVLMDPIHWDYCISIIKKLKTSKYKWSISSDQLHWNSIVYNDEQKKYLEKRIQRSNSIFYEHFVNRKKRPRYYNPIVHFDNRKTKVQNHWISLNGYDNFSGWLCYVGVETIFIDKTGRIRGSCGNKLFEKDFYYNIYDENFTQNFNPIIKPTICKTSRCICQPEVNCTKINLKEKNVTENF